MSWLSRIGAAFKAFTLQWGRGPASWGAYSLGSTWYNYRRDVGDARGNAAVMAVLGWVARTFPEAPLQVQLRNRQGDLEAMPDHPLTMLLERPNDYYSGLHLWTATLGDYLLTGNAYWVKMRSADTRVVNLWWLPASQVEPRWDDAGREFITHYDYQIDGDVVRIERADIVHFRDGFDPQNIRKGVSKLACLLREIATDNEAANFTASMLRNLGVPGVVIAPEGDQGPSPEDVAETKAQFAQSFGGDNRGQPLVMSGPTKVSVLSWSPEQLNLRDVGRRIPEERITAVYGVAAVVVGLGAGLDRSTYSNMAEAREAAYESMLIPLQRLLAADLEAQLLPEFVANTQRARLGWDYSQVRVLQADENELHTRAREDLKAGLLSLNQALALIGEDALPQEQGEVYYIPTTVSVRPVGELVPPPVAALPAGDGATEGAGEPTGPRALPAAAGFTPAQQAVLEQVRATLTRDAWASARWQDALLTGQRMLADAGLLDAESADYLSFAGFARIRALGLLPEREHKAADPAEIDDADLVAIRRRWDGVVADDLRGLLGATVANGNGAH